MASTYLTNGLTAGSGTIGTVSLWVKRSNLSTSTLYHFWEDNTTWCRLRFDSSDVLHWETRDNGTVNGKFKTNRVFRDTSAWYHIVVRVDTTQSTEADRFKLYVNGSEETSFSTSNYPTQNRDVKMTAQPYIGTEWQGSGVNYFDGNMTHIHYTDGQSYDASTFGETDSTSGIWKPKTAPSVTYGSKGFFLKFENSGAMGTDSSGNSNTFTVSGSLTQNVDTPSNNFATWNPLSSSSAYGGQNAPTNGNTTFVSGETGTNYPAYWSTLGASSGKWYFECKMGSSGGAGAMIGVSDQKQLTSYFGSGSYDYGYFGYDGTKFVSGSATSYGNSYGNNDIVGCAVDLDNNKLYFSKNGTWQNSGDPTSGSTGTGAISIADASSTTTGFYFFTAGDSGNSDAPTVNANFGSGFFGTTAVASANADGNNVGAFEYAVPSGYYALCTKNIKEFG